MTVSVFDITANKTIAETRDAFGETLLGYFDRTASHGPARAWFRYDFGDDDYDRDRGLLQFNTSTIPVGDAITKVEIFQKFSETPTPSIALGTPSFVSRYCLLGTDLTLAANLATWDAGALCFETTDETDGKWLDLGAGAPALINRSGVTTLNYRRADCNSINMGSFPLYSQIGSSKLSVSGTPVQLRVTHAPLHPPRKKWLTKAIQ